jgi:hypothetical protein
MFLKSWPADQVEGLQVAELVAFSPEVAADDPTNRARARGAARSIVNIIIVASLSLQVYRRRRATKLSHGISGCSYMGT